MVQWINNATGLMGTDERTRQPMVASMYGDSPDFNTMNDTLKAQQDAIRGNISARDAWNAKLSNVKASGGRPAPEPFKDWNQFMGPKPTMTVILDGYVGWESDGAIRPGTVIHLPFVPPLEDVPQVV